MKSRIWFAVVLLLPALSVGIGRVEMVHVEEPGYTIVNLGEQVTGGSVAIDVNNRGQVVAESTDNLGYMQAYLWDNGEVTSLTPEGMARSRVGGINNVGQIAGVVISDTEGTSFHPVIWWNDEIIELEMLAGQTGSASDINDAGLAVGLSTTVYPNFNPTAVWWENGTIFELEDTGHNGRALGVNESGQIVGEVEDGQGYGSAAVWEDNILLNIGSLGDRVGSMATGNNNLGQVVGTSVITGGQGMHAFLWQNGLMVDLGGESALAINNSGVIVGVAHPGRAVVWQDGQMIDLNTLLPLSSGWILTAANGINDFGWIVGEGLYQGNRRAFLLKPPTKLFIPLIATNN